ncbi:MAG: transcription antitermination factor NusB [Candidatus Dormibacteraceae bacterium]
MQRARLGRRHQARELALKVLFGLEAQPQDAEVALAYHVGEEGVPEAAAAFAGQLIRGVMDHRGELDRAIAAASRNWSLEQMAKVDRIILRIAIYEIVIARDVPVRAAINESIELAKTFSGEESGRFVNGVLGKIVESV